MTALVSLSTGGAITGFSLVPGAAAADLTSPTGTQIRLLALHQSARPATANDATLRSAIVNVANYYLRMAAGKTPAEMEALIWQHDSIDGVDHGASCAAFASLTLELAAQVVGQQSWVTGGTSYPWPLHKWADVRVDPNPASPGITSVRQDAQAHHRWHPLGDGYQPSPGDWVLFDGHVEVVTGYFGAVLHTVGGDSLPNFTVNAHRYAGPLSAQGVTGFVNNGELPAAAGQTQASRTQVPGGHQAGHHHRAAPGLAAIPGTAGAGSARPAPPRPARAAAVPATPVTASSPGSNEQPARRQPRRIRDRPSPGSQPPAQARQAGQKAATGAAVPGTGVSAPAATLRAAARGAAAIPGLSMTAHRLSAGPAAQSRARYSRHRPVAAITPPPDANVQQAFISRVAPGAVATQRKYGVPAAVTIAQAIDESGWGQSYLAIKDHNLFGIKGSGPAGSDLQPTQEFQNGQQVTQIASFRVYHSLGESIDDHGKLLATSQYYKQSMAQRQDPNAFAAALTGVYATDPGYGAKLIGLMQRYHLYRYDTPAQAPSPRATVPGGATSPKPGASSSPKPGGSASPKPGASTSSGPSGASSPGPGGVTSSGPGGVAGPGPGGVTSPRRGRVARPGPGWASIPGLPDPAPAPRATTSRPGPAAGATPGPGSQSEAPPPSSQAVPSPQDVSAKRLTAPASRGARPITARGARASTSQYQQHIPPPVKNAFVARARVPLTRAEPLYRDVASHSGIRWELLAACDWMQCKAKPRYSPVHGERLGTVNADGTTYRTRSAALEQCADDLVELAGAVYRVDLTAAGYLSVRDLANVFAAFRWGGLLRLHRTSAMEFPYSVAGLTVQHMRMRWPDIDEPDAPDKPGGRFHLPFGAVPIVLGLEYPATV